MAPVRARPALPAGGLDASTLLVVAAALTSPTRYGTGLYGGAPLTFRGAGSSYW